LNNESVRDSLPLPSTTKVNTYIIVARKHSPSVRSKPRSVTIT